MYVTAVSELMISHPRCIEKHAKVQDVKDLLAGAFLIVYAYPWWQAAITPVQRLGGLTRFVGGAHTRCPGCRGRQWNVDSPRVPSGRLPRIS
jgi:hypothetical protein